MLFVHAEERFLLPPQVTESIAILYEFCNGFTAINQNNLTVQNILTEIHVHKFRLSFGLQIFSDTSKTKALNFWSEKLKVSKDKFQKVIVTKSFKKATYRDKSAYGVLTIYFSNVKLRDNIVNAIDELRAIK